MHLYAVLAADTVAHRVYMTETLDDHRTFCGLPIDYQQYGIAFIEYGYSVPEHCTVCPACAEEARNGHPDVHPSRVLRVQSSASQAH